MQVEEAGDPDEGKIEELVKLTEDAKAVADSIGAPVARAAYHLEVARLEAEAAAGNQPSLTPRARVEPEAARPRTPPPGKERARSSGDP